jgi:hypothetical protein
MNNCSAVFAHPLHEMATIGLMMQVQPDVLYLTKADGAGDQHREQSTGKLLRELELVTSVENLSLSEKEIYRRWMLADFDWFHAIVLRIAEWLERVRPRRLITDGFEGFSPIHDLCPLLVDCACRRLDFDIKQREEVPLAYLGSGGGVDPDKANPLEVIHLNEEEVRIKRAYVARIQSLEAEAQKTVSGLPDELYQSEWLRPVMPGKDYSAPPVVGNWEDYDSHGKRRVTAGKYTDALNFRQHYRPLAAHLLAK